MSPDALALAGEDVLARKTLIGVANSLDTSQGPPTPTVYNIGLGGHTAT